MNYLSHYWLDAHRGDAAFSVGGALPDLARLRGTGFRLRPGGVGEEALTPIQARLEAGIARHYEIDATWHNSPVFARLAGLCRAGLDEAGIVLRRTSFACHIGAEMLLDRALLRREPDLARRFYACFTPEILHEAYALVDAKGHAAWLPRLREGMGHFVRRRFLEDYAGDYLAGTWPGIYTHVTGDEAAQSYPQRTWLTLVDRLTEQISQEVDFEELKKTL